MQRLGGDADDVVEGKASTHRSKASGEGEDAVSSSTGDRQRGEERSTRRHDPTRVQRKGREMGGKAKDVALYMIVGEVSSNLSPFAL